MHKRDPLYSWAKTLLASSRWGSTEFLLTWKAKATPAGRLLFQLAPSMPRTGEIGSGSSGSVWPTAVANDDNKSPAAHLAMKRRMPGGRRKAITSLQVAAKAVWPTATANDPEKRGNFAAERRNGLPGVVKAVWSTPRASDGEKGSPRQSFGSGATAPLPAQAYQSSEQEHTVALTQHPMARAIDTALYGDPLGLAPPALWATPTARDHKDGWSYGNAPHNGQLGRQVEPSPAAGSLTPEFVFWLMGYPPEYLACAPPATRSSRRSRPKS
ncbi:hypothetical protein PRJ39_06215 [Lysobacter enzymogenes]